MKLFNAVEEITQRNDQSAVLSGSSSILNSDPRCSSDYPGKVLTNLSNRNTLNSVKNNKTIPETSDFLDQRRKITDEH